MENVSLKLEPQFIKEIEKIMKKNRYMTKTEFIRQAIREKIKQLEKQETLKKIEKIFGSSKHKTTDEDLHKVRKELAEEYEKRFGFK